MVLWIIIGAVAKVSGYGDSNYTGWWLKRNPLKNDGVRQWEGLDIPYIMEK